MDKTKIMTLNGKMCNVILNGSRLEQVNTFQYVGSMITEDAEWKLARGQSAESGMKQIWKSHGIKLTTKVRRRPMKAPVWPVATYGCESWTIKKRDQQKIEAFQMKCIGPTQNSKGIVDTEENKRIGGGRNEPRTSQHDPKKEILWTLLFYPMILFIPRLPILSGILPFV